MLAAYLHAIQRQVMFPAANWAGFVEMPVDPIQGCKRIALQTPDGQRIAGWYRAPAAQGRPVILFFHGNGGGLDNMTARWEAFIARGYGLLAISYRGYPGSTGTPSERGLAIDARTAYDWLAARHAPGDVIIHGFSIGSGVAVALAAEVAAKALVLEAPFLSAIDLAREQFFWLPLELIMADTFRSDLKIGAIAMPLLIVHGTRDTIVPLSKGRQLFERAAEPKSFVTIEDGDHGDLQFRGLVAHIDAFVSRL